MRGETNRDLVTASLVHQVKKPMVGNDGRGGEGNSEANGNHHQGRNTMRMMMASADGGDDGMGINRPPHNLRGRA